MSARATAFAPGSTGNVAVGFDVLGFANDAVGDRVTVTRRPGSGVRITTCRGVVHDLPRDPEQNTAGAALIALQERVAPHVGFDVEIEKGIPLGSGLGGSASSAVAAVVAANALLDEPLPRASLLPFAAQGERVASGSVHLDNVAPSLLGGLVLCAGHEEALVRRLPVPAGVHAVVVHPHHFVSTKEARSILGATVSMTDFVAQSALLAGFICACFSGDLELLEHSLRDVVIEKQRRRLIPGFDDVQAAALDLGALGCSISGAGPSVFAWVRAADGPRIRAAMSSAFARHGLASEGWSFAIDSAGARLVDG